MVDRRTADLVAATLAGVAAVAGSFATSGRTPTFVAVPVADAVTDLAPGAGMAVAIERLGDLAQVLAFLTALAVTVGLFAAAARLALAAGRRSDVPLTAAATGLALGWFVAATLTNRAVLALTAAVPLAAVLAAAEYRWNLAGERPSRASRRAVLKAAGAVAGLAGLSAARGWTLTGVEEGPLREITDESTETVARERVQAARERSFAVGEMDALVSEAFYEVDVNSVNPNPTAEAWSLRITGAVESPLELSYGDLLDRELEHRFNTLRCVGDPLNGEKMDNALWTGVPVAPLLEEAGPQGGCECVMLRAADGFYEEFPLAALRPGLLAVGMNGRILPRGHGYPVRALVPGHWGEVNVKWLTEIEVLEREREGYWEQRGWHGTGPVNAVAKLHGQERTDDGRIVVGGHAYAGTRGVDRVEVSVDGGDSWAAAELTEPLPDPDTWRQWRYAFEPTMDAHEVVVRAVDGDGAVQPREFHQPYPSGATGWVSRTVER